jgi:hypothetical protein
MLVLNFVGGVPSDRISKATKDVNVYFYIHSINSCKLYQLIPVNYTSEFRTCLKLLRIYVLVHQLKFKFISPKELSDFLIKREDGAGFSVNGSTS